MRTTALILAVLLVAPACGRKKAPPPSATQPAVETPAAAPTPEAPPGVPAELKNLVDREWPAIQRAGDAFVAKFHEFETAKASGDRATMSTLAAEASKLYQSAADKWAEITYWPEDQLDAKRINQKSYEECLKFLSAKEKTVNDWTKKSKAVKEFSTAK